jgi:uncharacterized protein (TIGR02246 family)
VSPSWSAPLALVGLCTALTVGCTGSEPPANAGTLRAAVDSATTAFHQALRTNDTATFLSYVADDVVMMPPGEPPVRGKDALRAWYAAFLAQYRTSSLTLAHREVFVGAGWATELGSYEWGLTPTGAGAEVIDSGHYMQVWKQLPAGQWRFAREIWNSAVPASSAGK